jgi:hypothetical protein
MKLTPQYITIYNQPNSTCKPAPPPHSQGHIIDLDPQVSYIDQNLVCKLKISMSPTRQGQGLVSSSHPDR